MSGKTGRCFECVSLLNNVSRCGTMDSRLFEAGGPFQTRPRLTGSNNCFSEITGDVVPLWQCVNLGLNAQN